MEGGAAQLHIDVQECVEWNDWLKRKRVEETELTVELANFDNFIWKVPESESSALGG